MSKPKATLVTSDIYFQMFRNIGFATDIPTMESCCDGRDHPILANCLNCGRIICVLEGPGPCGTCGTLIQVLETEENILLKPNEFYHQEERPLVLDDNESYFNVRTDDSSDERNIIAKLNSRYTTPKITYDTSGCQIPIEYSIKSQESNIPLSESNLRLRYQEIGESVIIPQQKEKQRIHDQRIQDSSLQNMTDNGMCLSVHQPFASLIMDGIKQHEGRKWYTSFRGRLWIHAGAKKPDEQTIREIEDFYRRRNGEDTVFPKTYPLGCILGCVNQLDCLSQTEYFSHYPFGECGDSYVSIYERPQKLKVAVPLKGKPGIFPLNREFHLGIQKLLTFN